MKDLIFGFGFGFGRLEGRDIDVDTGGETGAGRAKTVGGRGELVCRCIGGTSNGSGAEGRSGADGG